MLRNQTIFGSAYPIFDIKAAADYYMSCSIQESILPNIMAGNVERFLGL